MKPSPIKRRALPGLLLCLGLAACGGPGGVTDSQKPSVALEATPGNLSASGNVTLTATASDNVGVTKVEFYDSGAKVGEDDSSPFTLAVPLTAANNGTHVFTARAFDAAGNNETSAPVNVVVNIATPVPGGVWDSSTWDAALFQ